MFKVILFQMTNAKMLQIMDDYFDRVRTSVFDLIAIITRLQLLLNAPFLMPLSRHQKHERRRCRTARHNAADVS